MKKKLLLFVLFSIYFTVILVNKEIHASETYSKNSIQSIYSYTTLDAKKIMIDNELYTVLLNDDLIYIIDSKGNIKKTLNYLNSFLYLTNQFNLEDISIEVIQDIDKLGNPDLLIIFKNNPSLHTVFTISYEDNKIIWKHSLTMKSVYLCDAFSYCDEPISISNYEVNDYLYLSGGYKIEKINLTDGNLVEEYQFKNNIWDFTMISDLNDNGVKDIAASVQNSPIIYLDGKTLNKIGEHKVIQNDFSINENFYVRPNITTMEFLPSRNVLVVGSEDGFVSEIDITNNELLKTTTQFFTPSVEEYRRLLNIESQFETFVENGKTYYSFKPDLLFTNLKIHKTVSIDQDQLEDYIVVKNNNQDIFIKCFSDSSCDFKNVDPSKYFKNTNGKIISYIFEDQLVIEDLKTKVVLMRIPYNRMNIVTFLFDNDMIMSNVEFIFNYDYSKTDSPQWVKSKQYIQDFITSPNRLITFSSSEGFSSSGHVTGYSIYDKDNNLIFSYESQNINFYKQILESNYLYLYGYKLDDQLEVSNYIHIVDINKGTIIDEHPIPSLNSEESRIVLLDLYPDINNDQIKEILIASTYYDFLNDKVKTKIYLYDLIEKNTLCELPIDDITSLNHLILYEDINGDTRPEILTYSLNTVDSKFNIYLSDKDHHFSDTQKLSYEYKIDLTNHLIKSVVDLNGDNYNELIFDYDDMFIKEEFKAHIIDFKVSQPTVYKNESYIKNPFYFLETSKDLNDDDLKEIVVIDANFDGSNYTGLPSNFKIINYDNGKITTLFEKTMIFDRLQSKKDIYQYVTYKDVNDDNIDDLVFHSSDFDKNTYFDIYDLDGSLLETYSYNFDKKLSNVKTKDQFIVYKSIDLKTIDNIDYYVIDAPNKFNNLDVFFNANSYKVAYLFDYSFLGIFQNKGIFRDEISRQIKLSELIIPESKFKNGDYYLKIHPSIKIDFIYIPENTFNDIYKKNTVHLALPDGEYSLLFLIKTQEGGTFFYYDYFKYQGREYLNIKLASMLGGILILLIGSKVLINRHYQIKGGVKNE